jgi:hypothetical protein
MPIAPAPSAESLSGPSAPSVEQQRRQENEPDREQDAAVADGRGEHPDRLRLVRAVCGGEEGEDG